MILLTHELLSFMLGVRRESVSRAASAFEKQGLISCGHSNIMLIDEAGLEKVSCNCYQSTLLAYEQTMGMTATG